MLKFTLSSLATLLLFTAATPSQAEFSSADGFSLSGSYLAGRSAEQGRESEIAADYLSKGAA